MKFYDYKLVFNKKVDIDDEDSFNAVDPIFKNTIHKYLDSKGENVNIHYIEKPFSKDKFIISIIDTKIDLSSELKNLNQKLKEATSSNEKLSFVSVQQITYECPVDFNPVDIKDAKINQDLLLLKKEDDTDALFVVNNNVVAMGFELAMTMAYGRYKRMNVVPKQGILSQDYNRGQEIVYDISEIPEDMINYL